ncbi:IS4 family transposase [Streptomyces sp. NBC_00829]|uniref:IS4 family transposase n=1 Tax=Streptomyces sp. NBC_00829 TaxID=2903679 RepID=UPI002F909DBE|nr:IS4 family transposase [Streptomyces sp. NBC_00829]WTB19681.1 IS4 family transposase [Streptomyces sp. NBC_00829]
MPRAGQVKPPVEERLSDRIALGVLTRAFPAELVDEVVAETGRVECRSRLLPARVVVYFVLAMCLFSGQAYEEVARLLTEGLAWAGRWRGRWDVPSTGAISRARARLGPEPLRALFVRVCRPVATPDTVGAWYRGRRVVAVDGTTLDVADTPANDAFFGRPGSGRGEKKGAFPQVRLVVLAECGTHAVFAAATGACTVAETVLADTLLPRLQQGMLLLADRNFLSFDRWKAAAGTGADLLWRVKSNAVLPVCEQYADGSYRSEIYAARDKRRVHGQLVRVVEYTIAGHEEAGPIRLVTTILDPEQAPAQELAALYHERWEVEGVLDEIKVHQRGADVVLRSRYPEGVEQEVYGFLLVHHALRQVMHQAAVETGTDPDRLSFTRSLRVVRRQVPAQAAFSP